MNMLTTLESANVTVDQNSSDREALEKLVTDNDELEKLEAIIGCFNIFEAVGVVKQELRHSDFLAFLLDPQQPHGFGSSFLRRFLQRVVRAHGHSKTPVSVVDLDVWARVHSR